MLYNIQWRSNISTHTGCIEGMLPLSLAERWVEDLNYRYGNIAFHWIEKEKNKSK
jgi:hypothetical protein